MCSSSIVYLKIYVFHFACSTQLTILRFKKLWILGISSDGDPIDKLSFAFRLLIGITPSSHLSIFNLQYIQVV